MFDALWISELLEIQSQLRSGCFTTREGYRVIRCVVNDKGNVASLFKRHIMKTYGEA
jgi:hypothetical protein